MDYINACIMKGLIKFHSLLFSVFLNKYLVFFSPNICYLCQQPGLLSDKLGVLE